MIARLGNVLYWLGWIIAALWTAFSFLASSGPGDNFGLKLFIASIGAVPSILIGWACRYVLAGK